MESRKKYPVSPVPILEWDTEKFDHITDGSEEDPITGDMDNVDPLPIIVDYSDEDEWYLPWVVIWLFHYY